MKLTTYAEVYGPEHPLAKMYEAGVKKMPGHLLRDLLEKSGGKYVVEGDMGDEVRKAAQNVARATGDKNLAAMAANKTYPISLEHLRGLDPDTTRIVYGFRLVKEAGDGRIGGLEP